MALTTKAAQLTSKVVKNPSVWLWTAQVLLAALFLMAGSAKLMMPIEAMQQGPVAFPGWFLRFLGVAEVAGAFGLILPGLFRIRPVLTPVAASCLIVIMIGAVTLSLIEGGVPMAILPFVAGVLLTFVAYGRVRLAPQTSRRSAPRLVLHPAA
jgi:uncharacterized membrane protein YphA (DoxX/SURF4 family)